MSTNHQFAFTQIDGKLSLEEATEQLVHLATCIKGTHTEASAKENRLLIQHMFDSRRVGIVVLLDLIQDYINQMPDDTKQTS